MPSGVPFYSLDEQHRVIKGEVMTALEKVFDKNQFILGESLTDFENLYASFSGTRYCIGVGNGMDAITLSLRALGIGPGHEVIVPAHTFIATWHAVAAVGAMPVPVEPDPRTFNIDVERIEAAMTPRTKAIIPVHLYGQSCDMNAVLRLAKKHNLFVVEDNAQSQGSTFDGKRTGSMGHCSATSFYPIKNLGSLGDAGAITTSDDGLAQTIRQLRNYGAVNRTLYQSVGANSRLDELQAAILTVKMKYLEQWNHQRAAIANEYQKEWKGVDGLVLPELQPNATHVYHLYVVRTPRRNALEEFLKKKGIGTMIHYPVPPHLQPVYANLGFKKGSFPVAEEITNTCLSLPLWPGMSPEQVSQVSKSVRSFFQG